MTGRTIDRATRSGGTFLLSVRTKVCKVSKYVVKIRIMNTKTGWERKRRSIATDVVVGAKGHGSCPFSFLSE